MASLLLVLLYKQLTDGTMKRIYPVLIALALAVSSTTANAGLINFSFSFSDANNGTDVTGIVEGLSDNLAGQLATSVEILTATGGFGVGEYVPGFNNSWDVFGGVVTDYDFLSLLVGGASPFPGLVMGPACGIICFGLDPDTTDGNVTANVGSVAFTAVPAPATIALFGLGLTGLGWSKRKKA